jgi:hypothetical protein
LHGLPQPPDHTFDMPESAVNREMTAGRVSSSLLLIHKVAIDLLRKGGASRWVAQTELPEALREYHRKKCFTIYNSQRAQIKEAAKALLYIWAWRCPTPESCMSSPDGISR